MFSHIPSSSQLLPDFVQVVPLLRSDSALHLSVALHKTPPFFCLFAVCDGVRALLHAGFFLVSADSILECSKPPGATKLRDAQRYGRNVKLKPDSSDRTAPGCSGCTG